MKNKKGLTLISLGLLLIGAALILTVYNIYDESRAARSAHQVIDCLDELFSYEELEQNAEDDTVTQVSDNTVDNTVEVEIPDYILNLDMDMPVENIDGQDYIGILEIPSCDLRLPVINEWSYSKLKIAPCRYVGSAYTNDLVIAAHNYRSHFGSLKNLTIGKKIIFIDMDRNIFTYEVVEMETLMPTAIEEMTSGDWDLTLFTCTKGGSYRVTVRCNLVTGGLDQ